MNPNPITSLDLELESAYGIDDVKNDQHKKLITNLMKQLDDYKKLYDSPDWKLISQV